MKQVIDVDYLETLYLIDPWNKVPGIEIPPQFKRKYDAIMSLYEDLQDELKELLREDLNETN